MAGTTNEKLELLRQTKADLKAALTEKGQTPGDVFADYPDMVRAISGGGGEQATPEIDVSEGGLITATAGDKTATEQLPTEPGKTVNAGSVEKIVVEAGKFVTGDIKVGAVVMDGADVSGVTADKSDVREFKVFVDADGNEKVGTQPTRTASDIAVKLRHVTVPTGIYDEQVELEVEPVIERLPAQAAYVTVRCGGNRKNEYNINTEIKVEVVRPSGVKKYFNHKHLPEIPADMAKEYPYALILCATESPHLLLLTDAPAYIWNNGTYYYLRVPGRSLRYKLSPVTNEWVVDGWLLATSYIDYNFSANINCEYTLWWSDHDIYMGENLVQSRTVVQDTKPSEPTTYAYADRSLPEIPAELLEEYPYAWIKSVTSGSTTSYTLYLSTGPWYYSNGYVTRTVSDATPYYSLSDGEWVHKGEASGNEYLYNGYGVYWCNFRIPNGSATTTSTYWYGTPAVPV